MNVEKPVNPSARSVRRSVLVWDIPTRLFHWLTVVLVTGAYVTVKLNWIDWHVRVGKSLLALLVFRVLWGYFGSETARFSRFLASPADAFRHLCHLFRRDEDTQVGHNAAGGWMVLLLLALLLVETLTGLYINNDIADEGPLSEWVPPWLANMISSVHAMGWDLLLAAIALHVLVIVFYMLVKGHNLVRPMLSGYKLLPSSVGAPQQKPAWLALVLLAAGAMVVTLLAIYI
jgi:cytochrome b